MKRTRTGRRRRLAWGRTALVFPALVLGAAPVCLAQAGEDERPPIQPRLQDLTPGGEPDPQQEMLELFQQVERRMLDIGELLLDASAGDTSRLGDAQASGIEELLKDAREPASLTGGVADLLSASHIQGEQVLEKIDRILELAAQNGGTAQGAMRGQDQPPEQSGQQQTGQQSGEKEQTPEGPRPDGQHQPQQGGEQPKDNGENPEESPQGRADQIPANETANPLHAARGAEQWGNLPIHLRELFRAEGGEQLPPRYRDWIDTYYRRLNQRSDD